MQQITITVEGSADSGKDILLDAIKQSLRTTDDKAVQKVLMSDLIIKFVSHTSEKSHIFMQFS